MNIIIKETGEMEELSIIDPSSGVDTVAEYIAGFVGKTGVLESDKFSYDKERDAYVCSQETFVWIKEIVQDGQKLKDLVHNLKGKHGHEAVETVLQEVSHLDFGSMARAALGKLSDVFGKKE